MIFSLNFDLIVDKINSVTGDYTPEPRDLPSDMTILEVWHSISDPGTQGLFGSQATFGLRNHEIFKADHTPLRDGENFVIVSDDTKTGKREAWALYPEWIDEFNLRQIQLPNVETEGVSNGNIGAIVTQLYKRSNIPFTPYNLRHCWAIRSIQFNMDPRLAALSLGHSLETHFKNYNKWFNRQEMKRAYHRLIHSSDRPQAPRLAK